MQADTHGTLRSLQKRRKAVIWAIGTMLLPLPLLISGLNDPGTFGRELIQRLGLLLAVCGILGRVWSTLYIGGRKSHRLVTTGPYSISRNPLYLFSFVAAAGLGAQTGSIVVALLFVLGAFLVFDPVIRAEEEALQTLFADEFRTYRMRVPRFGPRISGWTEAVDLQVDAGRVRQTILDGLYWLPLILAVEGVDRLHMSGIIQPVLRLP